MKAKLALVLCITASSALANSPVLGKNGGAHGGTCKDGKPGACEAGAKAIGGERALNVRAVTGRAVYWRFELTAEEEAALKESVREHARAQCDADVTAASEIKVGRAPGARDSGSGLSRWEGTGTFFCESALAHVFASTTVTADPICDPLSSDGWGCVSGSRNREQMMFLLKMHGAAHLFVEVEEKLRAKAVETCELQYARSRGGGAYSDPTHPKYASGQNWNPVRTADFRWNLVDASRKSDNSAGPMEIQITARFHCQ
jgi:hypothetical protein